METIQGAMNNPAEMSSQQWLFITVILSVIIIIGISYFVVRLYRIIAHERKSSYVPNIGRKRLNKQEDADKNALK